MKIKEARIPEVTSRRHHIGRMAPEPWSASHRNTGRLASGTAVGIRTECRSASTGICKLVNFLSTSPPLRVPALARTSTALRQVQMGKRVEVLGSGLWALGSKKPATRIRRRQSPSPPIKAADPPATEESPRSAAGQTSATFTGRTIHATVMHSAGEKPVFDYFLPVSKK